MHGKCAVVGQLGIGIILRNRIAAFRLYTGPADRLQLLRRDGIEIADGQMRPEAVLDEEQCAPVCAYEHVARLGECGGTRPEEASGIDDDSRGLRWLRHV